MSTPERREPAKAATYADASVANPRPGLRRQCDRSPGGDGRFVAEMLGLERVRVEGAEADMFALPDGSCFAVADPRGMGETSRSIGFLVADLDDAVAELQATGVELGVPAENERFRYVHVRAPDGKLYELVEAR
jgi:catechol 2,3-dioxygenase-like lactoylglutathione lyase family enzyme